MTENEREIRINEMKSAKDSDCFFASLYDYIKGRLELPADTKETNIYYLVLYSVRLKMPNEDVKTLESRLATVDCHQTSYIVSKKTLLMIEIERLLGVSVSADDATSAETVDAYAAVLWEAMKYEK